MASLLALVVLDMLAFLAVVLTVVELQPDPLSLLKGIVFCINSCRIPQLTNLHGWIGKPLAKPKLWVMFYMLIAMVHTYRTHPVGQKGCFRSWMPLFCFFPLRELWQGR